MFFCVYNKKTNLLDYLLNRFAKTKIRRCSSLGANQGGEFEAVGVETTSLIIFIQF